MTDNFRYYLDVLISAVENEVSIDLCKKKKTFKQEYSKFWDVHEKLEDLLEKKDSLNVKDTKLVRKFFELEPYVRTQEDTALYIHAFADCIKLLADYGWLQTGKGEQ